VFRHYGPVGYNEAGEDEVIRGRDAIAFAGRFVRDGIVGANN